MKQNVGGVDRALRIGLGFAIMLYGTLVLGNWIVSVAGLVVMGTGVFRFCGLYAVLGMSTCCSSKKSCCGGDSSCETPPPPVS